MISLTIVTLLYKSPRILHDSVNLCLEKMSYNSYKQTTNTLTMLLSSDGSLKGKTGIEMINTKCWYEVSSLNSEATQHDNKIRNENVPAWQGRYHQ